LQVKNRLVRLIRKMMERRRMAKVQLLIASMLTRRSKKKILEARDWDKVSLKRMNGKKRAIRKKIRSRKKEGRKLGRKV